MGRMTTTVEDPHGRRQDDQGWNGHLAVALYTLVASVAFAAGWAAENMRGTPQTPATGRRCPTDYCFVMNCERYGCPLDEPTTRRTTGVPYDWAATDDLAADAR